MVINDIPSKKISINASRLFLTLLLTGAILAADTEIRLLTPTMRIVYREGVGQVWQIIDNGKWRDRE
jgi:hypothetical protein